MKRQRLAITVRKVNAPDGEPSVLLQLPLDTSWVTMGAADARRIAAALLDSADELDEG